MDATHFIEESYIPTDYTSQYKNPPLMQHAFQFDIFNFSIEKNLHNHFLELEDYLYRLLNSSNDFIHPIFGSYNNALILNEAKEEFKNNALEIFASMRRGFEQSKRFYLFPDMHITNVIESAKQQLFLSYNQLIQKLAMQLSYNNALRSDSDSLSDNKLDEITTTKKKPGKSKFPKRARQMLDNWYQEHIDDPFPSHAEKQRLANECGITFKQVKCWFINVRRKHWSKFDEDADFSRQIEKKLRQNLESGPQLL